MQRDGEWIETVHVNLERRQLERSLLRVRARGLDGCLALRKTTALDRVDDRVETVFEVRDGEREIGGREAATERFQEVVIFRQVDLPARFVLGYTKGLADGVRVIAADFDRLELPGVGDLRPARVVERAVGEEDLELRGGRGLTVAGRVGILDGRRNVTRPLSWRTAPWRGRRY